MNRIVCSIVAAAGVAAVALPHSPALASTAGGAEKTRVGLLELEGSPADKPTPFDWLLGPEAEPTLRQIVNAIEEAADDNLDTLVIRLKDAELNRAQVEELGAAMKTLSAAGTKVCVFSDAYGGDELSLATYADEVVIQSGGGVMLPGIYMEEIFLADALSWIGVKADFVQVGDYKGANEMFMNAEPSPAWDQNITQLLDSLYENMRAEFRSGRKLSDGQLDRAMERAWLAEAAEAVEVGLVDAAVDLPDLGAHLAGGKAGAVAWIEIKPTSDAKPAADMSNPFAIFSILSKKPVHKPTGPTIAVLHIDGTIVDGDSQSGGLMGGGGSTGSRTVRNALEDILREPEIKGVVIRVDSPGGSATASEVMWQGIRRVAEVKPVWVSVGAMAASGGYYVSVAGDRIYVNPSSIVGSIGVVGGKFSLGGLYDTLKIRVKPRARGPMAAMLNSTEPWTAEQVALVRERMSKVYDLFTRRVAQGRGGIDLSKTAEGRLFTGSKAVGLKMADKIGGLDTAVEDLAAELGLATYDVMDYPGPKGFDEILEEMFSGMASSPIGGARRDAAAEVAGVLREIVGPDAWPVFSEALGAIMQLRREPVLLTMPRALIFR